VPYPYPGVRRLLDIPQSWESRSCLTSAAGRLSFAAVRDGTLRVAGGLRARDVGIGDCVAVCLPKCLESVLVIYGVHAAGAAYVPLHFGAPAFQLRESLRAIQPRLLITTPEIAAQFQTSAQPADAWTMATVEPASDGNGLNALLHGASPARQIPARGPRDLAAVMLTSGSTGVPKGVMRGHDSVPLQSWLAPGEILPEERFISTSALNYTSSHDVFLPLIGGCSVYLASEREAMFPDRVAVILAAEQITTWITTATALRLLLENGALQRHDLGALRRVRIAGEPLHPALLRRIMAAIPEAAFTNIYGATEAATMLCFEVPRPFPETMTAVPLGKPSGNFEIRLCDERGKAVPDGEIGEICAVGGPLMLGYWKDPELTQSRRLPGLPESYRTGDFGRRTADGLIFSAGRADHTIKIRGHRLDLGAVETALRAHARVREAAAFAMNPADGETLIHAAVLVQGGAVPAEELRRYCSERLPVFARPAAIIQLQDFPLLSTGKIDRTVLRALLAASAGT
jgi:amino acid adenylation domain-containing protein